MKTVFIVIPRRISVRYLLSAGFLEYFKQEQVKLVILTSITDQKFKAEFEKDNVEVVSIPMRDGKENLVEKTSRIFRNYIGGVGQRMQTFSAKSQMFSVWRRVVYVCSAPLCYVLLPLRRLLRYLDVALMSPFNDRKYEELFAVYKPDLVYIHSVLELTAVPVYRVAKRKHIPTVGTVLSWDNLGNKGEVYCHTDQLIVWNDYMKDQAVRYHNYAANDVFIFGTSQFDFYLTVKDELPSKEEFYRIKKLDPNKKLILYTTSPERIGGAEEIQAIRGIQKALDNNLSDCQMLLRVYSKDALERYVDFFNDSNIIIDDPKVIMTNPADSYAIQDKNFFVDLASEVKYADVVVNCVSTITLDATFFGTPTVNPAFGNQFFWLRTSHYSKISGTQGCVMAESIEIMIVKIRQCLENKDINKEGREKALKEICWKIDGHNLERTSNLILTYLKNV